MQKCVIKAKDPRLHQISVAATGFLTADPIPEGVLKVNLPPQYTTREATPSHPAIKEKEEKEEDEEIIYVLDSRITTTSSTSLSPRTSYQVILDISF